MTISTDPAPPLLSGKMILLLAFACGAVVANLYYSQPLAGPIAAALGLSPGAAGLIVTATQIGYGLGLLFIVPLGDLIENRALIVVTLVASAISLGVASFSADAGEFLTAALLIGLCSVAAQIIVPFAAHFVPPERRGQAVGQVMSGLLIGIMMSRPIASMTTDLLGWAAIFRISALTTLALAILLWVRLPQRHPASTQRYGELIRSLWFIWRTVPILRRRALYQAAAFGVFSLFWTTAPLELAGPDFGLSQKAIALFALVGVGGAVAAPIAGRLADRGHTRAATIGALLVIILALGLSFGLTPEPTIPVRLAAAAVLLDMGVAANLVLGQRALFALGADIRARLNGLYMAVFFCGGAAGSSLGAWAFEAGGWHAALIVGLVAPLAALGYRMTER